jgi:prephenate dehydrogenase
MRRVVIVGCGLIGGSIALGLRQNTPEITVAMVDFAHVLGSKAMASMGAELHALDDREFDPKRLEPDLVVLAVPISQILASLPIWLSLGVPVTDTGSTKTTIATFAQSLIGRECFVPGHPMAGKASGGFDHAEPDLFVNRPWILCTTGSSARATSVVEKLVEILGAQQINLDPQKHDQAVAITSHAPHIVASWLLAEAATAGALDTAGPAFKDMTRIAGPSENLWKDILGTNAANVAEVLRQGIDCLSRVAEDMERVPPDLERALKLFRQVRQARPT